MKNFILTIVFMLCPLLHVSAQQEFSLIEANVDKWHKDTRTMVNVQPPTVSYSDTLLKLESTSSLVNVEITIKDANGNIVFYNVCPAVSANVAEYENIASLPSGNYQVIIKNGDSYIYGYFMKP
jgi:hypothetical protein